MPKRILIVILIAVLVAAGAYYRGAPEPAAVPEAATGVADESVQEALRSGVDLNALDRLSGPDATILERFLRAIQMLRQDFNGRVLSNHDATCMANGKAMRPLLRARPP